MAQNVYECLFILDSNRYARDPHGVSGTIPTMVEKCGGEILVSRLYNEQKLAYPIDGHRKGTYWLTYFRMEGDEVAKFNRECQLNDHVVRNLTLKIEPRLVEAMVAHAKGEAAASEPEGDGNKAEAKPEKAEGEKAEGEKVGDGAES